MQEAISKIQTIEITRAVRTTTVDGLYIQKKQAIGLLNGKIVVSDNEIEDALVDTIQKADTENAEIITLYYGEEITEEQAKAIADKLERQYPDIEIEIVNGNQPHYHYIASIE